MEKEMNEKEFINLYMKLKSIGKTDAEIEEIFRKWQTEGDENGVKLVLI